MRQQSISTSQPINTKAIIIGGGSGTYIKKISELKNSIAYL